MHCKRFLTFITMHEQFRTKKIADRLMVCYSYENQIQQKPKYQSSTDIPLHHICTLRILLDQSVLFHLCTA